MARVCASQIANMVLASVGSNSVLNKERGLANLRAQAVHVSSYKCMHGADNVKRFNVPSNHSLAPAYCAVLFCVALPGSAPQSTRKSAAQRTQSGSW